MEKTTGATNSNSKRRRVVLSHVPTRFAFFAISAILLLSGLLAVQSNQNAWAGTFPGPNGQIAFVRDIVDEDAELNEIYVMNSDGSEQTRITDNDAADGNPSWSPDGEKIAFDTDRDSTEENFDNDEIYLMNSDGSGQTRLTDNDASDTNPSWSPDGEKIAFVSNRDETEENFEEGSEIYIMNSDGSEQTRLTDNDVNDYDPSWSPDGEKIAFVSNGGIYVMNANDGSDVTRLTDNDADDRFPSWSPDGEKIAFQRDFGEIYVMNANDGSDVTRLTDDPAFDGHPSWSPDGEKIAFVSGRNDPSGEEGSEIYVMNADDGSDVTRLTDNDLINDITPDWGTNTSPPGNGDDGTPTLPEQAIDDAISIIQSLDSIPQSLKTDIIALLEEIS
jgi:Tol biopolymer transport system component